MSAITKLLIPRVPLPKCTVIEDKERSKRIERTLCGRYWHPLKLNADQRRQRTQRTQSRLREHYGYRSEHKKQETAGVDRRGQRHALARHYRSLRRAAKMCDAAALKWLLDHGYSKHQISSYNRPNILPKTLWTRTGTHD